MPGKTEIFTLVFMLSDTINEDESCIGLDYNSALTQASDKHCGRNHFSLLLTQDFSVLFLYLQKAL